MLTDRISFTTALRLPFNMGWAAPARLYGVWRSLRYDFPMQPADSILFSGGAPGAEAEFGAGAERHAIEEVNFTFEGHRIVRHRGVRVLNHEELQSGDVSLEYVGRLMGRNYTDSPTIRKVLQTLWY